MRSLKVWINVKKINNVKRADFGSLFILSLIGGMVVEVTREEFHGLEKRVGVLEKSQAVTDNRLGAVEKKLDNIYDNTKWILRIIIGAVILAVLGLVIQGGL